VGLASRARRATAPPRLRRWKGCRNGCLRGVEEDGRSGTRPEAEGNDVVPAAEEVIFDFGFVAPPGR